jgi:catechol 2,3-dioxygenase-like lactoylglutathione lyase family enzyme
VGAPPANVSALVIFGAVVERLVRTHAHGENRSMAVQQIKHFNIRAPHDLLLTVRDFYCDALGLVEGYRPPFRSSGFWLYAGDEPIVHLVISPADDPRLTHVRATLDHVAFGCDDYAGTCSRLAALQVEYRSTAVPLLRQRQLFFRDPVGNGVELLFPD